MNGQIFRQKIIKETLALKDTLDWTDLINIHRRFNLKAIEHAFFTSAHEHSPR